MSQYSAGFSIATPQKPQAIYDLLTQTCPSFTLDSSYPRIGLGRRTADEQMHFRIADLTRPEDAIRAGRWSRHGVRPTVTVDLSLDPKLDSTRRTFFQTLNECVNRLDGDFYLFVTNAIPGGIAMWRHGDRIEVDPRRGSWWQPEHLRMFTFEYTQAHLPES